MAAIDKTYVNNWNDLQTIINWAKSVGTVIDDYGNKLTPYNWLYWSVDLTEEEFNKNQKCAWEKAKKRYNKNSENFNQEDYDWEVKHYGEDFLEHPELFYEVPVWNTSLVQDIYLIRYCPLEIIQNRLKEQYGGGWSKLALTDNNDESAYEKIKNRTSDYDRFVRNGCGKNVKFTIKKEELKIKDDYLRWTIYIDNDDHWKYYDDENMWYHDFECHEGKNYDRGSNDCFYLGNITERKIYRMLRRWNLPSGTHLEFRGIYNGYLKKVFTVIVKNK